MNMRIFYQNKGKGNMSFQELAAMKMAFNCPFMIEVQRKEEF